MLVILLYFWFPLHVLGPAPLKTETTKSATCSSLANLALLDSYLHMSGPAVHEAESVVPMKLFGFLA